MTTTLAKLLDTDEVSEYLGVPKRTLEGWRSTKNSGPPFAHIGKLVRYPENLLHEWVRAQTETPPLRGAR